MPTIQVMSDLHLELHRDHGRSFIESQDATGVDVLVLAGDILSAKFAKPVEETFRMFADKFPHIIYVPGNHEFWGTRPEQTITLLTNVTSKFSNISLLTDRATTVGNTRFLGGPMWFPQWRPLEDYAATQMPDFQLIEGFRDWSVKANARFIAFLDEELREGDVVVTHYLPSAKSTAPRFKRSPLNAFFVCETAPLIQDRKPSLWIHGHTHDACDYQLFNTRIVCNPFGYPTELNSGYREKLLIPIP